MNERDFEKRIIEMARAFGWRCYHFHDSRREVRPGVFVGDKDAAGVCDWILTHHDPPRLVFMEVKGDGGKLSDQQQEFLQAVKAVAEEQPLNCSSVEFPPLIGVMAVWPKDEAAVEQMLRTRSVGVT